MVYASDLIYRYISILNNTENVLYILNYIFDALLQYYKRKKTNDFFKSTVNDFAL